MTEPGPVEQALAELWPVAQRRLYSWNGLPTWLRLNRRFRLRLVRPSKVKVLVPAGKLPDCEACVELCCTGSNALVSLRLVDIARLVDGGLEAYISPRAADPAVSPTDGSNSGKGDRGSPARRRLEASVFASMFPVLSRDDTLTCRLLTEDRRCGAWPRWPLSCQRYPYAFDAEHDVVFLAEGCKSHKLISIDDAPNSVVKLVDGAIDAYNQRVKDIVLLHVALFELWELGVLRFLDLDPRLAAKAEPWGPSPSPPRRNELPRRLPVVD